MKCPGCGCNYMDDEKRCPMCEMPNNAFARAAHKMHKASHHKAGYDSTTCADKEHVRLDRRSGRVLPTDRQSSRTRSTAERQAASQTAARTASAVRSAAVNKEEANRKQAQPANAAKIIKAVIFFIILFNLIIPMLTGLLRFLF